MSHQINFYLSVDDVRCLIDVWQSVAPIHLLEERAPTQRPTILDPLEWRESAIFLRIVLQSQLDGVVMKHITSQGHWIVDSQVSPVVEFTTSFVRGDVLNRGRLYYVDNYLTPAHTSQAKPEEFRTWASKLFARTKKALVLRGSDYLGTGAQEFERLGGRLGMSFKSDTADD